MVVCDGILAVILALNFLKFQNIGVYGSTELCPIAAAVNLTGESPDRLGSVRKTDDVFTQETIWLNNGERLGCPCSFKTCVPFCCDTGFAGNELGCIADNLTSSTVPLVLMYNFTLFEVVKHGGIFHPFINPWKINSTDITVIKSYLLFENGSIHLPRWRGNIDFENYCFFREVGSHVYSVKVRLPPYNFLDGKVTFVVVCFAITIFFSLATFFAYSVVPELKNHHGLIFRCYLATYLGFCAALVGVWIERFVVLNIHMELAFVLIESYLGVACGFWINVISFDIWRTFRHIRSFENDANDRRRRRLRCYMIYGWLGPCLLIMLVKYSAFIFKTPDGRIERMINACLSITMVIVNLFLYISTSIAIKRRKKNIPELVNGVNKHHKENEQWFNLYFKLLIIMGVPYSLRPIAIILGNVELTIVVGVLQTLNSILIFFVLVWKDDIKRSLCKRFSEMLRMPCLSKRDSAPTSDNRIGLTKL